MGAIAKTVSEGGGLADLPPNTASQRMDNLIVTWCD